MPLGEQFHFSCEELALTPKKGCPTKGVHRKEFPEREDLEEVEFQFDELDCLRDPEPGSPPAGLQQ